MTDALIAGPNTPWNSRWVFGGKQPTAEDMNATRAPGQSLEGTPSLATLKALVEQAKSSSVEGGDTAQLKQAGETASKDLDALNALVSQYGGEIAGTNVEGAEKPAKPGMSLVSGGEYLSTMNAVKAPAGKDGAGAQAGFEQGGEQAGGKPSENSKSKVASRPDLQVLPGGISGGTQSGRLEGGLKSSQEEMKPVSYETVFMGAAPTTMRGNEPVGPIPPQMVTGHVVQGSMQRERLTSESLRNVSNGIQGMSAAGGGEMRIRMNPGNLGELMIRVSTNGKDVGLKVHASDSNAKKILEESLGSLRDSLAQQSLALGRVDVVIGTTASQDSNATSQQSNQQSSNQQHAQSQAQMNLDSNASQSGGGQWGNEESSGGNERGISTARGATARIASANAAMERAGTARTANSRLDVMA
jgi:flagellar hook-length control protein FliK